MFGARRVGTRPRSRSKLNRRAYLMLHGVALLTPSAGARSSESSAAQKMGTGGPPKSNVPTAPSGGVGPNEPVGPTAGGAVPVVANESVPESAAEAAPGPADESTAG